MTRCLVIFALPLLFLASILDLLLVKAVQTNNNDGSGASTCDVTIPTITLSNGVEMPQLALGTAVFAANDGLVPSNPNLVGFLPERVHRSVQLALENGLRHLDTAYIYRTHTGISQVLSSWWISGKLERSDLFLTTKVFHPPTPLAAKDTVMDLDNMTPDQVSQAVAQHFETSLMELGVGYVDLMLLHWPSSVEGRLEMQQQKKSSKAVKAARARRLAAWKVLESYYDSGWARAIGVSNFSDDHLRQLEEDGATIRPMVNQIETSVYLRHEQVIDYCREHDIVVESYSPLGRGVKNLNQDAVVLDIANKHKKTPGQIALRFLVQQGFAVTFYSSSAVRMESNMDIFSFALDQDDMDRLYALNTPEGTWGLPSPHNLD